MKRFPLTALALAMVGLTLGLGSTAEASTPSTPHANSRLVISPAPGKIVRSHLVRIRVRSVSGARLQIRLNGRRVDWDFRREGKGIRSLRASISHGLHRGRNLLRVTVRRDGRSVRTAKAHFRVRTRRIMVGAGRDQMAAVGGLLRMNGRLDRRARRSVRLRWKLVHMPRRHRGESKAPARLLRPHQLSPILRTHAPGRYKLRLTAGKGARATSDMVKVDVTPRNKLVPINTMTGSGADPERVGITVGNTTFSLVKATKVPSGTQGIIQVLVLDRKTLGLVSNRRYTNAQALSGDLNGLDSSKLVIFALQPNQGKSPDPGELNGILGRIGVPDYTELPRTPGAISAIGVPGIARGDANVNVLPNDSGGLALMTGYLTPDQYGGYGFVPDRSASFSFKPGPTDPCSSACDTKIGFTIHEKDARSLALGPQDGKFFNTGGPLATGEAEANQMAAALESVPQGDVVTIEAASTRGSNETVYKSPVAKISKGAMVRLANAVARVGGTRNGFNLIARENGALASGGMTYALVGWKGASEGEGAEVAANVFGAGAAPVLHGKLRPSRTSEMRPAQVTPADINSGPSEILLDRPSNDWPLDVGSGAAKAFSYLGSTHNSLSADPRTAYWSQPFDQAKWDELANQISAAKYSDVPPARKSDFTEKQFDVAQAELVKELGWVGNVRGYMANLANPFDTNILKGWTAAQTIADQIYKDAYEPRDDSAFRWLDFTEILLDLAGPFTDDITGEIASMLEYGVWATGGNSAGEPGGGQVRFTADQLGKVLSEQMEAAADTYQTMGDVIVSDPEKLSLVGQQGGCLPSDPQCKKGFSFTQADRTQVTADISRSIQRLAFTKLLPLGFHVFKLNPDTQENQHPGKAQNPANYGCGFYHPWSYYSPTAIKLATTALLQEMDPAGVDNGWQILVMARPPGGATVHGQPPSDELLTHMFSPSDPGNDPNAGGVGLFPDQLMSQEVWNYWFPNDDTPPDGDACYWGND